jgi:8-oxo-dGTP pyrophosphatase MutT (NUDIX family)
MITSAGFIIIKDKKILLLKSKKKHFDFPKGHVEPAEEIFQAAIRELKEETNIDIEDIKIIGGPDIISYKVIEQNEIKDKNVYYYYALLISDKEIKLSKEHEYYVWVPIDEAQKYVKFKEQLNLILNLKRLLNYGKEKA